MAEVILMPRLSDTMTEGVIAAWHKKVGDKVKKGDLLAEIETDKATMELESYKDGVLLHVGSDKGGKLQVNDLLAIIGAPGEDITSLIKQSATGKQQSVPVEASAKKEAVSNQQSKVASQSTEVLTKEGQHSPIEKAPAKSGQQTASAEASAVKPETLNQKPETSLDLSKVDEVVLMPRLSDTMTEGVIAEWHKKIGDLVKKGDVLADIETDKATMELESYKNGTLLYIGAQKGEKIEVNALLCVIGEKGKVDVDAIVASSKGSTGEQSGVGSREATTAKSTANGGQQPETRNQKLETSNPPSQGYGGQSQKPETNNGRLKASPLAKKLAKEKGIDLKLVHGTGDGGRITKEDIDNFKSSSSKAGGGLQEVLSFPSITGEEGHTDIPNSQMRKTIARRLGESMFTAPHFYLTMELNMDNAIAARTQMNEYSPVKISFQDIIIKACAMTLRKHPAVNSSWMGDFIRTYHHIHIGSAVAVPEGLIVPVIKFADQKSFAQIATEAKELYEKARNKKLQPHEFTGNTFTISNLGMMDIEEFTAIINPPDSCILAVGRIREIVVKKDTGFATSNVMKVTMSCDHRCVDGAVGATFLQTLKKLIENPIGMLM